MTAPSSFTPPSVLEDLVDVLYRPAEVFERRREMVAFGLAMVILTAATTVVYLAARSALEPVFDAALRQQIAEVLRRNPGIQEEQLAAGRGMMQASVVIGLLVQPVLGPLIGGVVLWLVGRLCGARPGLGSATMIATYAYTPRFIGFLSGSLMAAFLPEERIRTVFDTTLSVARLFDPSTTSLPMLGALARLDPFYVWQVGIMGIGISVLGGVSRPRGILVAILAWLAGFLMLIPTLLTG